MNKLQLTDALKQTNNRILKLTQRVDKLKIQLKNSYKEIYMLRTNKLRHEATINSIETLIHNYTRS